MQSYTPENVLTMRPSCSLCLNPLTSATSCPQLSCCHLFCSICLSESQRGSNAYQCPFDGTQSYLNYLDGSVLTGVEWVLGNHQQARDPSCSQYLCQVMDALNRSVNYKRVVCRTYCEKNACVTPYCPYDHNDMSIRNIGCPLGQRCSRGRNCPYMHNSPPPPIMQQGQGFPQGGQMYPQNPGPPMLPPMPPSGQGFYGGNPGMPPNPAFAFPNSMNTTGFPNMNPMPTVPTGFPNMNQMPAAPTGFPNMNQMPAAPTGFPNMNPMSTAPTGFPGANPKQGFGPANFGNPMGGGFPGAGGMGQKQGFGPGMMAPMATVGKIGLSPAAMGQMGNMGPPGFSPPMGGPNFNMMPPSPQYPTPVVMMPSVNPGPQNSYAPGPPNSYAPGPPNSYAPGPPQSGRPQSGPHHSGHPNSGHSGPPKQHKPQGPFQYHRPASWYQLGNPIPTALVPVNTTDKHYKEISDLFHKTSPNVMIDAIERVHNYKLYTIYAMKHEAFCVAAGRVIAIKHLFHGTSGTAPKVIYDSDTGLDSRVGRGMWGQGTYYAVNSSYSVNYSYQMPSGNKQMFCCAVIVGDYATLPSTPSLIKPPANPKGGNCHSVQGHTGGSDVFITYEPAMSYPTYLITFQ